MKYQDKKGVRTHVVVEHQLVFIRLFLYICWFDQHPDIFFGISLLSSFLFCTTVCQTQGTHRLTACMSVGALLTYVWVPCWQTVVFWWMPWRPGMNDGLKWALQERATQSEAGGDGILTGDRSLHFWADLSRFKCGFTGLQDHKKEAKTTELYSIKTST